MEKFESTSLFVVTNLPPCDVCDSDLQPLFCHGDGRNGPAADVRLNIHVDKDARSAFVVVDSRGTLQWSESNVALNCFTFGDSRLGVQQLCQETVSLELSACADSQVVRITKSLAEKGNLPLVQVSDDAIAVRGSFAAIQRLRADLRADVLKAAAAEAAAAATTCNTCDTVPSASLRLDCLMKTGELPGAKTYELDVDLVAEMPIVVSGLNQDVLLFMAKVLEGNIEGAQYNAPQGEVFIVKPTKEEVELCRKKFMALYESLLSPCPNHVRTISVKVPPERDAQNVDSIVARMNQQHVQCVLYHEPFHQVKIISNSEEKLSCAKEQLQSLLLIPSTDRFNLEGGRNLTIKKGNIESEKTTSLVCPTNNRLQHTSGLAADINKASQGTLQKKSDDIMQQCGVLTVGNIVMIVGGGTLQNKNVYHVVLPDMSCGPQTSYAVVEDIVLKLLGYVERHKVQSITLPLLISDVFSDKNVVAKLMVETIIDYKFSTKPPVLSDIVICVTIEADLIYLTRYLYQKKIERLARQSNDDSSTEIQSGLTSMYISDMDGQQSLTISPSPLAMTKLTSVFPGLPLPSHMTGQSPVSNPSSSDPVKCKVELDSLAGNNLEFKKIPVRQYGACPICKMTPASGAVTTTCCHQICCHDCWKKSTKLSNKCSLCKCNPEAMSVAYSARTQNDPLKFTNTSQALYHHFKDYW